jgi:hypothetical protein
MSTQKVVRRSSRLAKMNDVTNLKYNLKKDEDVEEEEEYEEEYDTDDGSFSRVSDAQSDGDDVDIPKLKYNPKKAGKITKAKITYHLYTLFCFIASWVFVSLPFFQAVQIVRQAESDIQLGIHLTAAMLAILASLVMGVITGDRITSGVKNRKSSVFAVIIGVSICIILIINLTLMSSVNESENTMVRLLATNPVAVLILMGICPVVLMYDKNRSRRTKVIIVVLGLLLFPPLPKNLLRLYNHCDSSYNLDLTNMYLTIFE